MQLKLTGLFIAAWTLHMSAHAAPVNAQAEAATDSTVRELAPAQLAAIRAIGRTVLAAKKSATDDPADAEQLGRLRAAVDALAAVELETGDRAAITLQGGGSARSQAHTRAAERRDAARADARALAGQLRERGGILASRAQAGESGTTSAGLPVTGQRAQLFERLSSKLDAALSEAGPERAAKLLELRAQLDPRAGRLGEGRPLGTPTLQAVPSTSPTPIRAVETAEPKAQSTPAKAKPRKPKAQ